MSDTNKVVLIGRLTKDPELKHTQQGTAVCRFSIANGKTYTISGEKKEETHYFDCIAWGKAAEIINEYCTKGKQLAIEGRLTQSRWESNGEKRSKVEITIEAFQFLGAGKSAESKPESQPEPGDVPSFDDAHQFDDSNIPF